MQRPAGSQCIPRTRLWKTSSETGTEAWGVEDCWDQPSGAPLGIRRPPVAYLIDLVNAK